MGKESWYRYVLDQVSWQSQARATTLVAMAVVFLLVLGAVYLTQSARTAAAGRNLQVLEARRQALEQQNAQLRAEIAALQSVPYLTRRAEGLGLRAATAEDIEYLPLPDLAPASAATPTPIPTPEPFAYDESIDSWLREQWEIFLDQVQIFIQQVPEQ